MPTVSFSGIASGIDGDSIIKALLDARRLAAVPLEQKIEHNNKETEALEELNTKLLSLTSSLKEFLTLAGGAVSKSATSSNEDAVAAAASSGAVNGSTTFTVEQLARPAMVTFGDRYTSLDAPVAPSIAATGSISFTIGTGGSAKTISVPIGASTTVGGLVDAINDALPGEIQASAINTGTETSPQYAVVVQGLQSGLDKGTLAVSVSPEVSGAGAFQTPVVTQAQNAILNITGIGQISRSSNQVGDLIPGLSLSLKQANTGPVTVTVQQDTDASAKKVSGIVDAINDVIRFSQQNGKVERVEGEKNVTNVFGTLARTRIDDRVIESIRGALSSSRSNVVGSKVQIFADLGVTTERDGTLKFDEAAFRDALTKEPIASQRLLESFADTTGSINGVIQQYTKFKGLIDTAIDSNTEETESLNERIARLDRNLEQQRASLQRVFSNLESTTSRLQSGGQALSGLIAGLSAK